MRFRCRRCGYEFEIIGKVRKDDCKGIYVLMVDLIKKAIKCPKCQTAKIKQL